MFLVIPGFNLGTQVIPIISRMLEIGFTLKLFLNYSTQEIAIKCSSMTTKSYSASEIALSMNWPVDKSILNNILIYSRV